MTTSDRHLKTKKLPLVPQTNIYVLDYTFGNRLFYGLCISWTRKVKSCSLYDPRMNGPVSVHCTRE